MLILRLKPFYLFTLQLEEIKNILNTPKNKGEKTRSYCKIHLDNDGYLIKAFHCSSQETFIVCISASLT